jgi:hypothetical protein
MRSKFDGLMWGLILIVAGGLFMARNMGYEVDLTPVFWMGACAVLSAVSFIRYFAGERAHWGLLFPACQFAAVAIIIGLSEAGVHDSIIGAPLFIGFAIPFAVAFLVDRQKNYWAVIPVAVFSALTLATLFSDRAAGHLLGAWVVFAMAAPFFFIYFTQEKQWWAIIPAGILGSIGVTSLIGAIIPAFDESIWQGTVFFMGFAATFGVLYLRRNTIPTTWAKVPALVFSGIALLTLMGSIGVNGGALILIALGVLLLFSTARPRQHTVS